MSSLAKDICSQRSYRSRRRREIFRLKKTTQDMERKIQFLESQVEYYDKYLKQCLANLHAAKKKRVHFRTPNNSVFISYIHSDLKCARKFKKSKTIKTLEITNQFHEKKIF